jgi:ribonuclease PH
MNVVQLAHGDLVKTQATAEHNSFTRTQLGQTPDAEKGIHELLTAQRSFLDHSA